MAPLKEPFDIFVINIVALTMASRIVWVEAEQRNAPEKALIHDILI